MKNKFWIRLVWALVLLLLGALGYFRMVIYPQLDLISGFAAKSVASCHYIDGRSLDQIHRDDNDIPKVNWYSASLDPSAPSVEANVWGLKTRQAIYREGLGATLISETPFSLNNDVPQRPLRYKPTSFEPFTPTSAVNTQMPGIDYPALQKAVAAAFDPPHTQQQRTRALLVIHNDQLVAEQYAPGYGPKSVFLGWSMSKSVMATMYGILAHQKRLHWNDPMAIRPWQTDVRRHIRIGDLLQMSSGLQWEEAYDKICDATLMLFQQPDMMQSQLQKPLAYKPGTHWNYSSGTSNLLSGYLRRYYPTHQAYLDAWYSQLLDRIGMHSAVVEVDMAGTYVGSSYAWASARDWGRFGLLYLHQGCWGKDQLFDPEWAQFVQTPCKGSQGLYGGHFWLNQDGHWPDLPRNAYYASGYQGQYVVIFPDQNTVIVRLGLNEEPQFQPNRIFEPILQALQTPK